MCIYWNSIYFDTQSILVTKIISSKIFHITTALFAIIRYFFLFDYQNVGVAFYFYSKIKTDSFTWLIRFYIKSSTAERFYIETSTAERNIFRCSLIVALDCFCYLSSLFYVILSMIAERFFIKVMTAERFCFLPFQRKVEM